MNSSLYDVQSMATTPFLIKVTHPYTGIAGSQLPTQTEISNCVKVQNATQRTITTKTGCTIAGAVFHQKKCDMYYYVQDTIGVRAVLLTLFRQKNYKHSLLIKEDRKWDSYFSVLYPTEEERETIYYERVIAKLFKAGDKLKKPHKVTHWVYFKNEADMKTCEGILCQKPYIFIEKNKKPYPSNSYQMSFYQVSPITKEAILGSIKNIKKHLADNAGAYGGWQTIVAVR
ncbi:MAG: DUF695 domain-containing protein [Bacteroidetes bacterium]|nr:DUF695 domain-containing protein [Bacteroidota bacterium]